MEKIVVICPCGREYEVPETMEGKIVTCVACKAPLRVKNKQKATAVRAKDVTLRPRMRGKHAGRIVRQEARELLIAGLALAVLGMGGWALFRYGQSSADDLYRRGVACEMSDPEQAAIWFRRAADQGHAEARFRFGIALARGVGVPEETEHERIVETGTRSSRHSDCFVEPFKHFPDNARSSVSYAALGFWPSRSFPRSAGGCDSRGRAGACGLHRRCCLPCHRIPAGGSAGP